MPFPENLSMIWGDGVLFCVVLLLQLLILWSWWFFFNNSKKKIPARACHSKLLSDNFWDFVLFAKPYNHPRRVLDSKIADDGYIKDCEDW